MHMKDWVNEVDSILKMRHYDVLDNKGKISAEEAKEKAELEYGRYRVIQDKKYLSDFDKMVKNLKKDKK